MTDTISSALSHVTDPVTGSPLPDSGRLQGIDHRDHVVTLVITAGADGAADQALKAELEARLGGLEDVERVRVVFEGLRPEAGQGPSPRSARQSEDVLPPARFLIAVGSGKGGVGKSTVAANLAAACVRSGLKTGFMDADVYGPSGPRLFGLTDAPGLQKKDGAIEPLEAHGIKLVSMGFLVGERDPVVWRGPMVTGAVRQFLTEVNWGDLDVLIIDMPPGTGDVQLALAQGVPLTGVVIVSTPQDLALDDARKAMALFERVEIPVLGLIENMSVFLCPHCGEPSEIFGHGGTRSEAGLLGLPFLGEIPLHMKLRQDSDAGHLASDETDPVTRAFDQIAHHMLDEAASAARPAPEIIFED